MNGFVQRSENIKDVPTVLIIFGATGDLMGRKVLPALAHLHQKKKLPEKFRVIGVSRKKLSDEEFKKFVTNTLTNHCVEHCADYVKKRGEVRKFLELFYYVSGDLGELKDYSKIKELLEKTDSEWSVCSNKLFYLAVPSYLYETVLKNLSKSGLPNMCAHDNEHAKIVFEKPFGQDLRTAEKLEKLLSELFDEKQLYLIDHYLGKGVVENILIFRFANNFFESFWNNKYIDKIEINLLETVGVENRGKFYDSVGALKDMAQSHALAMLSLILMDNPTVFEAETIRRSRAKALQGLKPLTKEEVEKFTFRAQYEGYEKISGVKKNSQTETYFKVVAFVDNPRWKGVPIIIQSGKKLKNTRKEAVIYLKHPNPCLCPPGTDHHYQNRIVFSLEPKEEIKLFFKSKKPNLNLFVGDHKLKFLYKDRRKKLMYIEAYEKLFHDCILSNKTFFLTYEEVNASWKFIDSIIKVWKKGTVPLTKYKPNSDEVLKKSLIVEQKLNGYNGLRKEIGIIGLGKMGSNLALNLVSKGWRVVGFDLSKKSVAGVITVNSLKELVQSLKPPRIVWIMVPSNNVNKVISELEELLNKGDVIIDGGNSFYEDSVKRFNKLKKKGLNFVDVGVSGGPQGALFGACLMVGGEEKNYNKLTPLFVDLSTPMGFDFFKGPGAGHFVKMVHNGIEYGMMQAIAEGFNVLKNSPYNLGLERVAKVYNNGSVIQSRLIDWLVQGFEKHGEKLNNVSGIVGHTGEGEWTVKTASKLGVNVDCIKSAVNFRLENNDSNSYVGKVLQVLREQFGGHKA